jgi:DNA-binding NarL/FixJ family response regulator
VDAAVESIQASARRRHPSSVEILRTASPAEPAPTARETQVLKLIAEGLANHEIAKELCLSEDTVKSHIVRLLHKLDACSRTHAVTIGFRRGIIS